MTATDPKVSVIIPAYNMQSHIADAVRSALQQDYQNIEVIAVNDNSSDRTGEILDELAITDARLRVVHRSNNSNLPAVPRNVGLQIADGDYVAFLDHDDTWFPWKITRQVRILEEAPEVALAYSHLLSTRRGWPLFGLLTLPRRGNWHPQFDPLFHGSSIQCSSVLARRHIVEEFGGFSEDPALRAVEDFHLWFRISRRLPVVFVAEIQGRYRVWPGSTSQASDDAGQITFLNVSLGCALPEASGKTVDRVRRLLELPASIGSLFVIAPILRALNMVPRHITHRIPSASWNE